MCDETWPVPMPKVPHLVLDSIEVKERVIIVGDVHGCLEELKVLLEKCMERHGDCTVVLVGDMVNKGPLSAEVVSYVRNSGLLCVRGNHDDTALSHCLGTGLKAKDTSYNYVDDLSRDDITWLQELPYSISIPSMNIVVVHAGLVPHVPLEQQSRSNMVTMRNFVVSTEQADDHTEEIYTDMKNSTELYKVAKISLRGTAKTSEGEAWAKVWSDRAANNEQCSESGSDGVLPHVYFGHDAKRGLQKYEHATGLDTGCVYGRKLTAIVLPDREIMQVDALKMYVGPAGDDI